MKKLFLIAGLATIAVSVVSCGAEGNDPGRTYMPDMAYSRAYETYGYNNIGDYERLTEKGVHYNGLPVVGTIARGDAPWYPYEGSDTGYLQSVNFKNPLDTARLTAAHKKEAERLYLVNCAICHGSKLDGNGPLWKDGDGPYPAAPQNLLNEYSKKLADGQIYHVIVHGKGQMGSYASQLKPEERWWVVQYIRDKQRGTGGATDSTAATPAAANGATPAAGGATATGTQGAATTQQ